MRPRSAWGWDVIKECAPPVVVLVIALCMQVQESRSPKEASSLLIQS